MSCHPVLPLSRGVPVSRDKRQSHELSGKGATHILSSGPTLDYSLKLSIHLTCEASPTGQPLICPKSGSHSLPQPPCRSATTITVTLLLPCPSLLSNWAATSVPYPLCKPSGSQDTAQIDTHLRACALAVLFRTLSPRKPPGSFILCLGLNVTSPKGPALINLLEQEPQLYVPSAYFTHGPPPTHTHTLFSCTDFLIEYLL